ncbi:MAG TPA: HAD-IA family hydrolase [Phycisphaerae bacterium]|nr:HAD-IA family hydrolase [Phycisphaerae bacterium]HPS52104.1 HAD-IA family hydrolase [Phycisphaerae bacterium]
MNNNWDMSKYDVIFFDLDGTLTDPSMEMVSSAVYALQKCGIASPDKAKLQKFLTEPLLECFEQHFGMTQEQANEAFNHYWQYYATQGISRNKPYNGVPELLDKLSEQGKIMCVATARQTENAVGVLAATGLTRYFTHILGASNDMSRRTKKMIIFDLIASIGEHDMEKIIMVGDRTADILGAQANGIDTIGVTWGQDSQDEIKATNPTYMANSVKEMADLLL